ncbi:MAG: hypothetical protein ACKOUM_11245, partial [Sphingopyxis sp.]
MLDQQDDGAFARALAAVPAGQRRQNGTAMIARWRRRADVAALHAQLLALAACPPADAAAFADALHPWHRDDAWVRALLDQGVAALMDDPLADIRLSARPGVVIDTLGLIDAGHGAAALSIVAADGMGGPPDARIALDGGTTVLIALNDAGLRVDHFRLNNGDGAEGADRTAGARLRCVG